MNVVKKAPNFIVVDNFLSAIDAEEVWKYMQAITYNQVTAKDWKGGWRLDDGPVMQSVCNYYGDFQHGHFKYPTKLGIDLLIKAMLDHSNQFSDLIGVKDKDWVVMTAVAMLYPRDCGLYWHKDAPTWSGSWTYYAHPEWNIQWGGELLIADLKEKISPEYGVWLAKNRTLMGIQGEHSFGAHLDNKDGNELILKEGLGTYIMPKSNRLVIIGEGAPHCVSKVHPAAGDHLRASVSGFFLRA